MGDPLIWVLGGCVVIAAIGAAVIDRWRRRGNRGFWPVGLWALAPFVVVGVPAFGCAIFASEAAARDGACMAFGGAMIALPILYWPVWLVGTAVGVLVDRAVARR